jgi:hypothetical protein
MRIESLTLARNLRTMGELFEGRVVAGGGYEKPCRQVGLTVPRQLPPES